MQTIDYYFTSSSPYAYLGHEEIRSVAGRHGLKIMPLPVDLSAVWAVSGQVPLAERPKIRQDYRLVDLKRIAERRGLPITAKPAFFPVDASIADLTAIVLIEKEINPLDFMEKVFTGLWVREENIADRVQIETYLTELGIEAEEILELAQAPQAAAVRKANSDAAVAVGLPGVPGYVFAGEAFFGQDRIDDLEHALDSGRAPFLVEG